MNQIVDINILIILIHFYTGWTFYSGILWNGKLAIPKEK